MLPMAGGVSRPSGLDFGAVLAMGAALGADQALLAEVLPGVEVAVLAGASDEVGVDPEQIEGEGG